MRVAAVRALDVAAAHAAPELDDGRAEGGEAGADDRGVGFDFGPHRGVVGAV